MDEGLSLEPFPELREDLEACDAAGVEYSVGAITAAFSAVVTVAVPFPADISGATASAWGLDRALPLYLTLSLAQSHYLAAAQPPDFRVSHRHRNESKSGLASPSSFSFY